MASRIIDSATFSRRGTLGLLLGGVAAAAIAPRRGWAASGTVVVSNWGGDWNDRTVRYVEKPLLEDKGFSIVRDLGTEGAGYADVGLRQAVAEGIVPGPRMLVATRAIVATGRPSS